MTCHIEELKVSNDIQIQLKSGDRFENLSCIICSNRLSVRREGYSHPKLAVCGGTESAKWFTSGPTSTYAIGLQVMVYFLLCNRGLLFAILVSGCAIKRQTWHIFAISLRCEVIMCYITFKTPTMQLAVGNWGWAFGSSASRVPPSRT